MQLGFELQHLTFKSRNIYHRQPFDKLQPLIASNNREISVPISTLSCEARRPRLLCRQNLELFIHQISSYKKRIYSFGI